MQPVYLLQDGKKERNTCQFVENLHFLRISDVFYICLFVFHLFSPNARYCQAIILRGLWQLHNDRVMILRLVCTPRSVRHSPVFGKLWAVFFCCLTRGENRFRGLLYKIQNGFPGVKRLGHEGGRSYLSAEVNYASSRTLTHPHALMAFTATMPFVWHSEPSLLSYDGNRTPPVLSSLSLSFKTGYIVRYVKLHPIYHIPFCRIRQFSVFGVYCSTMSTQNSTRAAVKSLEDT